VVTPRGFRTHQALSVFTHYLCPHKSKARIDTPSAATRQWNERTIQCRYGSESSIFDLRSPRGSHDHPSSIPMKELYVGFCGRRTAVAFLNARFSCGRSPTRTHVWEPTPN
jgi:hypothetical protein